MNFLQQQQLKSHCQKCGRRNRNYNYQRQKCSLSMITQTDDNHTRSKHSFNRKSQLIQVQPMIYLRENINK